MNDGEQVVDADSTPAPVEQLDTAPSPAPTDIGGQADQTSSTTSPTSPVDPGAAAEEPRQRDERGRFNSQSDTAPDPVKAAIDRLAIPSKDAVPTPKANPVTPSKSAENSQTADPLTDNPLSDFSDVERHVLKGKTTSRIQDLHGRWRASEAKLNEVMPHVERGREFGAIVDQYDLTTDLTHVPPEHLAGLVNAQAAVNRAIIAKSQGKTPSQSDLDFVETFSKNLAGVRADLGMTSLESKSSASPFVGELPEDLNDLVTIYGLPETEVRQLAAIRASTERQPELSRREEPPAPVIEKGPDLESLYTGRTIKELEASGAANGRSQLTALLQNPATKTEVMQRFPGVAANDVTKVFDALDPRERMDILLTVHRNGIKPPVPATKPSIPAPTRQPLNGRSPQQGSTTGKLDAVQLAINRLASN